MPLPAMHDAYTCDDVCVTKYRNNDVFVTFFSNMYCTTTLEAVK